jgi:hypothetical protein
MIDAEDVLKTAKDGSRSRVVNYAEGSGGYQDGAKDGSRNRVASHAEDSGRHQDRTKEPDSGNKDFKRRITV